MSAWIVGTDHLDLLVTAAAEWQIISPELADETGRMLWTENLASVAHRYPHDGDGERPAPDDFSDHDVHRYRFHRYPGRVDPEVVATAVSSLIYQSCEHPGWPASAACSWTTHLREQAAARIPAYVKEFGTIDLARQAPGDRNWYVYIDQHGNRKVSSSDAWAVPDRDVFHRAAALRVAPDHPADTPATP